MSQRHFNCYSAPMTLVISPDRPTAKRLGLLLAAMLLLSACRMPVFVSGEGFVFGEQSGQIYRGGHVFNINEDFEETFWPVPAPGHSFARWTRICNDRAGACQVSLDQPLWSQDQTVPLIARYRADYAGPLDLLDYEGLIDPGGSLITVPIASIVLSGASTTENPRFFMATTDLAVVVPAVIEGGSLQFTVPEGSARRQDYLLFVSATDTDGVIASTSFRFGIADRVRQSALSPVREDSPWADVLPGCAAANGPFQLCTLNTLPFLGSTHPNPDVDAVLERTVVTHPWMGVRFEQVLRRLPPDMLKMFRGVTAVVIGSRVRPAFYTSATGAIYLDPQNLWLNPDERDSIDWEPDYRFDFALDLNFISYELYLAGTKSAWLPSFAYLEGESRTLADILWPMANLLIHELAHANDAMPPRLLPWVAPTDTVLEATYRVDGQTPSRDLLFTYPLRSALLYELGSVLFFGAPTNPAIASLGPVDIGLEFEQDIANALYAYATPYEDTAMLIEEVLTSHYFGLDRVASFLAVPTSENPDCGEYTVGWGSINRAANPAIRERARLVLSGILDEADVSRYLGSLPPERNIQSGLGICDSLPLLSNADRSIPGRFVKPTEIAREQILRLNTHRVMRERGRRGRTTRR
jgi:hypothetical protein